MRMRLTIIVMLVAGLALLSCGPLDHRREPIIVSQILSDPAFDGDISQDPATAGTYTVRQGNKESVFIGIDPATSVEYRAFLDFSLDWPGGAPRHTNIASATLDIVINTIQPQPLSGTIPVRIDLVSLVSSTLVGSDFDRTLQPALATLTLHPISQADVGNHVPVDVTVLMQEAQRLQMTHFRIRILNDLGQAALGLIEINDTTGSNRWLLAPLLELRYY